MGTESEVVEGQVMPELTDSEKLEFVYQFAVQMTQIFQALADNPMASMMLGGIRFDNGENK